MNRLGNVKYVCTHPQSDTGTNYYKEIPLSEILAVDTKKSNGSSDNGSSEAAAAASALPGTHCFEIRTANVDYYVGECSPGPSGNKFDPEVARQWELAIRQALMPVVQVS